MRSLVARGLCLALLAAGALRVSAADPPGAEHWTAAQLKEFGPALAKKMGPQKVASQQLAAFENHSVLVAHREGDGQAELHRRQVDLIIIQSGEAMIRVGGELVGRQGSPAQRVARHVNQWRCGQEAGRRRRAARACRHPTSDVRAGGAAGDLSGGENRCSVLIDRTGELTCRHLVCAS